jgi:hypothetical protein
MKMRTRRAVAPFLLLSAFSFGQQSIPALETRAVESPGQTHRMVASAVPSPPRSSRFPRIPGRGRILFSAGPGIGVLAPDGLATLFGTWDVADAVWDPLHLGHILVNPYTNDLPRLMEFRPSDGGWRRVARWTTGYGETSEISPDGRFLAYNVFVHGRETWQVRVASRDGLVRELGSPGLEPVSWTPGGRVLLSGWDPRRLYAWDPFAETVDALDPDWGLASKVPRGSRSPELGLSQMSWSAVGGYFAAPAIWKEDGADRSGVAIGSASDGVTAVIPSGQFGESVPVWSPSGSELAFVVPRGHTKQSGALHVYDASTGKDEIVRQHVATPWWVAWSPSGDWMLLDDEDGHTWVFVSRDGRRMVQYPELGTFPRWASPGIGIHIVVC